MSEVKKPVVVKLASGAEYGLPDAATAKRAYPGGEIVRYQDGSPYEEPKPKAKAKPAPKKGAKK